MTIGYWILVRLLPRRDMLMTHSIRLVIFITCVSVSMTGWRERGDDRYHEYLHYIRNHMYDSMSQIVYQFIQLYYLQGTTQGSSYPNRSRPSTLLLEEPSNHTTK